MSVVIGERGYIRQYVAMEFQTTSFINHILKTILPAWNKKLSLIAHPLLSIAIGCFSFFAQDAHADVYHFHQNQAQLTWGVTWKNRYIDSTYDTSTHTLTWKAQFEEHDGSWPYATYAGRLPEGFQLVMSEGPMPAMTGGQYAMYYFDASNLSNPKLTVYAYTGDHYFDGVNFHFDSYRDGVDNCGPSKPCADTASSESSVQPPDRIASSLVNSSFIHSLTAYDEIIAGKRVRTLGFSIDITTILNHHPLYPTANTWKGSGFGKQIGYWFHPVIEMQNISYLNGYLSLWQPKNYALYDPENPFNTLGCVSNQSTTTWTPGQPIELLVSGFSDDGNFLNYQLGNSYSVFSSTGSYSGTFPYTTNVMVRGTAPASDTTQSYNTGVTFTNSQNVSVFCPLMVTVNANIPPVCNISGASTNLSCSNPYASVNLNAYSSYDADNAPSPLTYSWSTDCPGGSFSNSFGVSPSFSFASTSGNIPVSCTVGLTVSDGFRSTSCQSAVGVAGCNLDCKGIINGTSVFDSCGVCGGTNNVDRCGVCNGDGSSCLVCSEVDNSTILANLDQNSARQATLVKRANSRIIALSRKNRVLVHQASQSSAEAGALHVKNWQAAWSLPIISRSCGNTTLCTTVSTVTTREAYEKTSLRLYTLLQQAVSRLISLHKKATAEDNRLLLLGKRLYLQNQQLLNQAPQSTTTCN